jgi:PAS domain S-box-containing protein
MVRAPTAAPGFVEEGLHERRNLASAVVDTVGALVLVLDPDRRIVRFNRAPEKSAGYSAGEMTGRNV